MSIPGELEKPLEEIKNPILRFALIGCVLIIMTLAGVVAYQDRNSNKNLKQQNTQKDAQIEKLNIRIDQLNVEVQRLNNVIIDYRSAEYERLKRRQEYMDSMIQLTNLIKRSK